MIAPASQLHKPQLFYRITALWVVCEAFAGGMMHAAKIPFTGMLVSSLAVACIALLAWFVPGKGNILKATLTVAIFKLLLSPHSPPTAYIAVFFQGLIGQLLLANKKNFTAALILVAILSLAESALQRLLVVWLVYGDGFWTGVNQFIQKLTGDKQLTNYSLMIAAGYILIHIVAGFFVGRWISRLIKNSDTWQEKNSSFIYRATPAPGIQQIPATKKKKRKLVFVIISICLLVLYLLSLLKPEWIPLPGNKLLAIFFRSVVILACWYFLLAPVLMGLIKKQLLKKQAENKEDINTVMEMLPEMKTIFQQAWQHSAEKRGFGRLQLFGKIVMANVIRSS
jgi:hypothetical protein